MRACPLHSLCLGNVNAMCYSIFTLQDLKTGSFSTEVPAHAMELYVFYDYSLKSIHCNIRNNFVFFFNKPAVPPLMLKEIAVSACYSCVNLPVLICFTLLLLPFFLGLIPWTVSWLHLGRPPMFFYLSKSGVQHLWLKCHPSCKQEWLFQKSVLIFVFLESGCLLPAPPI